MTDRIALQLWTIRDALGADPDRALERVKASGFTAVEVAPPPEGLAPEQLADRLAYHGLSVVSIHGDLPRRENIDSWLKFASECDCSKIIWHGWPRDARFDSPEGISELISAFDEAGKLARDNGLSLGLHNHWWKFEPAGGIAPIRRFHEALAPEIFWQLDVYWAQTAGVDPVDIVAMLGSRLGSLHWKDGPALHGEPMTALGRGKVDLRRIHHALTYPVDWIVELDECASDPLEAASEGLVLLRGLASESGLRID